MTLHPVSKKRFQHSFIVHQNDIDDLGHVNNVVYLRWVQEVAAAHWNALAPPEMLKKYRWIVLRHEIDYRSPAMPGDTILAETWVDDFSGAKSNRIVMLYRQPTHKLLTEAKTTWCLLDAVTMKPKRIEADVVRVFD